MRSAMPRIVMRDGGAMLYSSPIQLPEAPISWPVRPRPSPRARLGTVGDPASRARAGNRPDREGLYRSGRARRHHRGLRDQDRAAQRRRASSPRPGVDPAFKEALLSRRHQGGRHAWATSAGSATIWSRSRTRRSATTWSCARCAPAIRGRCSGCRRSGTSRHPTARARSRTRAACWPISASTLPKDTEIRVWDSTAETRFLVLPMRPAGTEGWSEDKLAELVTRDSMIGTGLPQEARRGVVMDSIHDMGGMDGFGKVEAEPNEPVFHAPWEGRVLAMQRAMGYAGAWHIDHSRFAQEKLPPATYLDCLLLSALGAGDGEATCWSAATPPPRNRRRPRADARPDAASASSPPTWSRPA